MWKRRFNLGPVEYFRFVTRLYASTHTRGQGALGHFESFLLADPIGSRIDDLPDPKLRYFRGYRKLVRAGSVPRQSLRTYLAALRWLGHFDHAWRLSVAMLSFGPLRAEGFLTLADMHHLRGLWARELSSYRARKTWLDVRAERITDDLPVTIPPDAARSFRRAIWFYRQSLVSGVDYLARAGLARAYFDTRQYAMALAEYRSILTSYPKDRVSRKRMQFSECLVRVEDSPALFKPTRNRTGRRPAHFRVPVRNVIDVCQELGLDYRELHPQQRLSYEYSLVFRGRTHRRSIDLLLSAIFRAELKNVDDLGFGLLLVDRRFLAIDTKHLPEPETKLFTHCVKEHDPEQAIVRVPNDMTRVSGDGPITPLSSHDNYYHWTLEALGQAALMSRTADGEAKLLVPENLRPHQRQSLARLVPHLSVEDGLAQYPRLTHFDRIVYFSHLSRDQVTHPLAVQMLRKELGIVETAPRPGKWVYLDRRGNSRASLRNAQAIGAFLEGEGFEAVDAGSMSFDAQQAFFRDAEIIVAPGGAALTNLLFCPPRAKVVILGSVLGTFETFSSLAAGVGMESWLCLGSIVDWVPNPLFVWSEWGFKIDTADLALCLQQCKAALKADAAAGTQSMREIEPARPATKLPLDGPRE